MAIETEDNGGQFDIFWQQQQDDHYDIRMVAPFGGGTSFLKVRPQLAMFTNGNGEQLVEKILNCYWRKLKAGNFLSRVYVTGSWVYPYPENRPG